MLGGLQALREAPVPEPPAGKRRPPFLLRETTDLARVAKARSDLAVSLAPPGRGGQANLWKTGPKPPHVGSHQWVRLPL